MSSETSGASSSSKFLWAGRITSAIPVIALLASGLMKLSNSAQVVEGFAKFGYPQKLLLPIGLAEILCTIVYLIPRTSVRGAVLLTGYLGGATATHVRISDVFIPPIILGIMVWGGLYFRDPRLRALLPLRS